MADWKTASEIASTVGILGTLVAIIGLWHSWYSVKEAFHTTNRIEMVRLAREMTKEFYGGDHIFQDVRKAIESKKTLYKGHGGEFDHDQINRYLGFFDDLGFYWQKGSLTTDIINQLFGAYIVEAYEYGPVTKYIEELRRDMEHEKAFANFEDLARELEKPVEKAKQVKKIKEFFQE